MTTNLSVKVYSRDLEHIDEQAQNGRTEKVKN
jgi:hypothetical protein